MNTNDGGVVFDEQVRNFFNYFHSPHVPEFTEKNLEVVSLNPATFLGRGGFKILQFLTPFQKSKLVVNTQDEVSKFKFDNNNNIILIFYLIYRKLLSKLQT